MASPDVHPCLASVAGRRDHQQAHRAAHPSVQRRRIEGPCEALVGVNVVVGVVGGLQSGVYGDITMKYTTRTRTVRPNSNTIRRTRALEDAGDEAIDDTNAPFFTTQILLPRTNARLQTARRRDARAIELGYEPSRDRSWPQV